MNLVVRSVRLADGRTADVHCEGSRIARLVSPPDTEAPRNGGGAELNGSGQLLLPGLIIPDLHLDQHATAGSTVVDVASSAEHVVRMALVRGVGALRAFADVGPALGLTAVEGLLRARERWGGAMTIQIGPFPRWGFGDRRTVDLMDEALRLGADVVGGIPGIEESAEAAERHIATSFEIAARRNVPVHLLIDDTAGPSGRTLEMLAEQTVERGFAGRVCASNCIALAFEDPEHAGRVIDLVAGARISVVSNAHVNLIEAGSGPPAAAPRTRTLIRELHRAGVNVALGQGGGDDVHYPWGQADPLEVAFIVSHAVPLAKPEEIRLLLDMVTTNAANAMGLAEHKYPHHLVPGAPADLMLVKAPTWHEALQYRPADRVVIRAGRVVAQSETITRFSNE